MTSIKQLALLLALIPTLPAQQDRFGNPACAGPDNGLAAPGAYDAVFHRSPLRFCVLYSCVIPFEISSQQSPII